MTATELPRILVMGNARHGKDTVSEILSTEYGLSFVSSSEFACQKVIFPVLGPKYGYKTEKQCFDDRVNHRAEWYTLIRDYNKDDATRLGREIWKECDVYCGLRSIEEFMALRDANVFDFSIWVDASTRIREKEGPASMTVHPHLCDYILDNNGSLKDLHRRVRELMWNKI